MTARKARAERVSGPARRTYLCLEGQRRKPSDYEVTTTALLYYPARGFEVPTPVWQHYLTYQRGSQLHFPTDESFEDPSHLTYSSYVAQRRDQEAFLDRLFERPARALSPALQALLGPVSALRFPLHGLQMVAAYVGAMAPSGRISVVAAFQAADELRRIQRLCQWLSRSGSSLGELDALGRELWQQGPAFQPLRKLIEQLLISFDWGEALISLNGVLKPELESVLFSQLTELARAHDEEVLEQTLRSLAEDARWHEAWYAQLVRVLVAGNADNEAVIAGVVARLQPAGKQAVQALARAVPGLVRQVEVQHGNAL